MAPPSSMTNHGSTPRSRRIATASLAARPETSSLQPKESQTSRPGMTPSAMRSSTAWQVATSEPLQSSAPRPQTNPSASSAAKGGCVHAEGSSTGTTSRWAMSTTGASRVAPRPAHEQGVAADPLDLAGLVQSREARAQLVQQRREGRPVLPVAVPVRDRRDADQRPQRLDRRLPVAASHPRSVCRPAGRVQGMPPRPPAVPRHMADYGHDLQFGVFASPDAARVHETLELAQLADVLGPRPLHRAGPPLQRDAPRHLDPADGRRRAHLAIRVAHNVANLPLRPPVGLAKQIATLDLVSGGRAELGLGTGAFWDAIVAAGGERRTPEGGRRRPRRGDPRHPGRVGAGPGPGAARGR